MNCLRLLGSLGDNMGSVIVVYKILPDGPEHFDAVKQAVEKLRPQRIEEEPIGFGVKALKMTIVIPEEGGKEEAIEKQLRDIPHVNSVETVAVSRSL